jgi:hydrophobe/amphiphile efflux-1 (HAE1) family protein
VAKFFLDRPIFAGVIAIILTLVGIMAMKRLPIEQYPEMVPPVVSVQTRFPGASAQTLSESVAAPLEQAINGVQNMIYMYSNSAVPGNLNLDVYFEIGSDPDLALTNVQNKINLAMPSLPDAVKDSGIIVSRKSPSPLIFVSIESPDGLLDDIYVANYASVRVADELQRIKGVASASVFNARDYSMRIWVKPDLLVQFHLTVADVINAVRAQSAIRSIGQIGQEPNVIPVDLTIPVNASGRLNTPKEFEEVVLKVAPDGATVRLKDVAYVELGAKSYELIGKRNGKSGSYIAIFQDSGANAIDVAAKVRKKMAELSEFFPMGLSYDVPYDNSIYISMSVEEVIHTIFEAGVLVSIVIFIFLHSFRATLVPLVAMVVSIIGTFMGMLFIGFSINILSLFGLVLAVGIVVDDAIVVVEGIERNMATGLSAKEAAFKTMEEVSGPIVAITLVLCSVFIPVGFIGGIPGKFYQQFALTISISVLFSGFISLTLSPVLTALLLDKKKKDTKWSSWGEKFNHLFDQVTHRYLLGVSFLMNHKKLGRIGIGLVLFLIVFLGRSVPIGFVPPEDQGYFIISAVMPDGTSINRVEEVSEKITKIVKSHPDVENVFSFSGYDVLQSIQRSNMGTYYVTLKDWKNRKRANQSSFAITNAIDAELQGIEEAEISTFAPPDIPGIGVVGGFDFWVIDRSEDSNMQELDTVVKAVVAEGEKSPEIFDMFITAVKANCLGMFLDLDVVKTRALGVRVEEVYQTLQTLLGSVFVDNFNRFGKIFQVVAQADPAYRDDIADIGSVFVRSDSDHMVPLKSLVTPRFLSNPTFASRFNGSPAALISCIPSGGSPGEIIDKMEEIAKKAIPPSMSYGWGGLAYQEKNSGGASGGAVLGGLVVVFLVLSALYERWMLPLTILFAIPFGVLGTIVAVWMTGKSIDLYVQIGIVALIGLSAKNAILIIEFARVKMDEGLPPMEAALEAARLRFRPILMTSLVFIFGAIPLVMTSGAGAESRHSLGVGVIGGMVMATILGIFFIPYFFRGMEEFLSKRRKK